MTSILCLGSQLYDQAEKGKIRGKSPGWKEMFTNEKVRPGVVIMRHFPMQMQADECICTSIPARNAIFLGKSCRHEVAKMHLFVGATKAALDDQMGSRVHISS